MRFFSSIIASIALMSCAQSPAQAQQVETLTWGFETWECGDSWFQIRLGNIVGQDIEVLALNGYISAAALPGAETKQQTGVGGTQTNFLRQSLVSILPGGATRVPRGKVSFSPNHWTASHDRWTHSVDKNLIALNVKQMGQDVVHFPFSAAGNGAIAPDGVLLALIDTQTYNGSATVTDKPNECLDTEVHVVVTFRSVP